MQVKDTPTTKESPDIEITQPSPDFFIRKSKNSKYIIEYEKFKCIGISTCAAMAPNTFIMDTETNLADVAALEEEDDDEEILAAAQSCPVFAIIVKDAKTGEQIFPPPEFE